VKNITNLFSAIQQVIDRLNAELDSVTAYKLSDFNEVDISAWPTPAVYVVLDSITPGRGVGDVVEIAQVIQVVAVVYNAYDTHTGEGADTEGGTLAAQIIKALQNWEPEDFDPLSLQPGEPLDFAPGRLVIPLAFGTSARLAAHNPYPN